jgi:alpha-amylase
MGFDAIWISPIVDNFGNGYHGYYAANWEKTNSNFGSDQDLKDLVSAAHSKGIYVMVDVVANHVAPVGEDFSKIYPFNKAEHYHPRCQINNWNNQNEVENCRLADLPDLN